MIGSKVEQRIVAAHVAGVTHRDLCKRFKLSPARLKAIVERYGAKWDTVEKAKPWAYGNKHRATP